MSLFNWSDSNYLNLSIGTQGSALAITMMAWFKFASVSAAAVLLEIADTQAGGNEWDLDMSNTGVLQTWNTSVSTSTGTQFVTGRWYHVGFTLNSTASTGSMTPYVDGIAGTASPTGAGLTTGHTWGFFVGRDAVAGSPLPSSTLVSNVKVWQGAALNKQEMRREAFSYQPLSQLASLKCWMPCFYNGHSGRDLSGKRNDFTANGTLNTGQEPTRLIRPKRFRTPFGKASSFIWQQLTDPDAGLPPAPPTQFVGV